METRMQEWLTVPEVAKHLRIPRSRAYELIQGGELPAVRIGERSIRVNRTEGGVPGAKPSSTASGA